MIVKIDETGSRGRPRPLPYSRRDRPGRRHHPTSTLDVIVSVFEITGLVIVGVGFLGLIAYIARHARQWDDE
jgi:hypothetical protein